MQLPAKARHFSDEFVLLAVQLPYPILNPLSHVEPLLRLHGRHEGRAAQSSARVVAGAWVFEHTQASRSTYVYMNLTNLAMNICIYLSVYISFCLSLSVCLSGSACLPVCRSLSASVCLSLPVSASVPVRASPCVSVRFRACLSVRPSVCLCMSVSVSVSDCLSRPP